MEIWKRYLLTLQNIWQICSRYMYLRKNLKTQYKWKNNYWIVESIAAKGGILYFSEHFLQEKERDWLFGVLRDLQHFFSYITTFTGQVTSITGPFILTKSRSDIILILRPRAPRRRAITTILKVFGMTRLGNQTSDLPHLRRTLYHYIHRGRGGRAYFLQLHVEFTSDLKLST